MEFYGTQCLRKVCASEVPSELKGRILKGGEIQVGRDKVRVVIQDSYVSVKKRAQSKDVFCITGRGFIEGKYDNARLVEKEIELYFKDQVESWGLQSYFLYNWDVVTEGDRVGIGLWFSEKLSAES